MRHNASMVAEMEGICRPVFRIARELSQNSRSGLTVRFLSKKLELPQEEIEYLVDVNHRLLFTDLTKIKLPSEGITAVKRVADGLENLGDVPALFRRVKMLSAHDYRLLEEKLGIESPKSKKAVAEHIVETCFRHPDSVIEYVATHGFSPKALEVFDVVWQSPGGIVPVPKIRAACNGTDYEVEQALWELFRGMALFEMFRFDSEDRLIRVAGLLSEIRQWREEHGTGRNKRPTLRGARIGAAAPRNHSLSFTDTLCRLVATVAAKPVRLRGDGELFREDSRRLSDIVDEESEPSLSTYLWAAEGVGWLLRVDNQLRAGELEPLIDHDYLARHRIAFDWMMAMGSETNSRRAFANVLEDLKPKSWYRVTDFVRYAVAAQEDDSRPVLRPMGGHYRYVGPTAVSGLDRALARSLEETLSWLGAVEIANDGNVTFFRVTELGVYLMTGEGRDALRKRFHKHRSEIVVQPNFDIVVPSEDMDPLLTVPLDQFARRQSTGQAAVYHLSKETFTQGLQDGHDGDTFVDFLLTHNRGGTLPPNVMTTLDDWRGGLRRVRLRTIHVIESDDPLVMADLRHRRKLSKYLNDVDASRTAMYTGVRKSELCRTLERDGFIVE